MQSYVKSLPVFLLLGLIFVLIPIKGQSIPAFARKYGLSCTACHAVYPKLNATGQEFRKLGYRFPFEVEDYLSGKSDKSKKNDSKQSLQDNKKSPDDKLNQLMSSHKSSTDLIPTITDTEKSQEKTPALQGPAVDPPTESEDTSEIGQLKKAIDLLQKRVAELEQKKKAEATAQATPAPAAPQPTPEQSMLEKISNISNVLSVKGEFQYSYMNTSGSGNSNNFSVGEVDLFYAGEATHNLSFFVHETLASQGATSELEEAKLQYNFYNDSTHYFALRVGQMHPIYEDGFGAFDRSIGISSPLALTASYPNTSAFSLDAPQIGVQGYYNFDKTRVILTGVNGVDSTGDGTAFPSNDNAKDFSLGIEHIFNESGSSLSLYYYHGMQINNLFPGNDTYQRVALGGNYTFVPVSLDVMAALVYGNDHGSGTSIESKGAFLECDKQIKDALWALARYDYLNPNNTTGSNTDIHSGTVGLVWAIMEHGRLSGEYQYTRDNSETLYSGKDNHQVTLDLQFIF